MSVYFRNKEDFINQTPRAIPFAETMPSHEKIGDVFSRAITVLKSDNLNNVTPLLKDLGIDPSDKTAVSEMCSLLTQLDDNTLQVSPLVSGVFLLKKKDPTSLLNPFKEIAVFKVGRKRACMEILARNTVNLLGLGKHVLPGMYCAMLDLPLYEQVDDEDTTEDLWNGHQKVYCQNKPLIKQSTQMLYDPMMQFELEWDAQDPDAITTNSSDFTQSVEESLSKGTSPQLRRSVASSDFTRTEEGDQSQSFSSEVTPSSEEKEPKKIIPSPLRSFSGTEEWDIDDDEKSALPVKSEVFSTASAVVGIVQPFLCDTQEADVYEFTLMTIAALAIGLRDGKHDGFKGSTLFDVEDNFPIRIDPLYAKGQMCSSCTVDLLYLDKDERTNKHLTKEHINQLYQIVSKWNLFDIMKKLEKGTILYMDSISEKMGIDTEGKDEGNFEVLIAEGVEHAINGTFNTLQNNPKHRILNQEQLNAANTRLVRIRDFITKCFLEETTFCPEDLVDAVDIAQKVYKEKLQAESANIPISTQRVLKTSGPHHVTGRVSPPAAQLQITEREVQKKSRGALQTFESCDELSATELTHPLGRLQVTRDSEDRELGIAVSPVRLIDSEDEQFGI